MPVFTYKAKNSFSEDVKGKVEAEDVKKAQLILTERGLFVVSLRLTRNSLVFFNYFNRVTFDDIIGFTRQLSTMITAGLSLLDSLEILDRQQKKSMMKKLIGEIVRDIEAGTSFAESLGRHPVFSRVYVNLVKAGEAAGVLNDILSRLADNLEREKEFRGKVKGALIYPAIVMLAMTVVASITMIFVVPQLSEMYKDFGADLPLMTQILISFSEVFSQFWYLFFGFGFGGFSLFWRWRRSSVGARRFDMWLLKLPVFGILQQKILLTELARTMSLLLSAGVSLLETIEIASEALENVIYREALKECYNLVEKGNSFALSLERYQFFPAILSQMVSVGEETGQLDQVLSKLAKYFETESEQAVKGLTTALEPMIMMVLGLGVGFLVVAIIMPIYNLTNQF